MRFVVPGTPTGTPAVMIIRSPLSPRPCSLIHVEAKSNRASVFEKGSTRTGVTPQANLWSAQVLKNSDFLSKLFGDLTDVSQGFSMAFMIAMREIEPGDIHARRDQSFDLVRVFSCRPDRADCFCSSYKIHFL